MLLELERKELARISPFWFRPAVATGDSAADVTFEWHLFANKKTMRNRHAPAILSTRKGFYSERCVRSHIVHITYRYFISVLIFMSMLEFYGKGSILQNSELLCYLQNSDHESYFDKWYLIWEGRSLIQLLFFLLLGVGGGRDYWGLNLGCFTTDSSFS